MKATPEDLRALDEANERFLEDVSDYQLRYRCESCAHLDAPSAVCSLGYPNDTLVGPVRAISADGNLTFCKYFELGEQTMGTDAVVDAV